MIPSGATHRIGDTYYKMVSGVWFYLGTNGFWYTSIACYDDGISPEPIHADSVCKYNRQLKGVTVDVYDVLKAFNVTCPALQHLVKKALCTGLRGHKNAEQDLQDIIDSANRAMELHRENLD